jgi:type I restriction enzyme S subunit
MSSQELATNNNQVPEGYKKTEVGVIPEDWEYQAIGEAFEIRNNLRLPISKEKRQYIQGKYPYYGPTNVQDYIDEYRVEGEHALIGEDGDHFLKWRDLSMTLLVDGKFNVNNHAHIIKGVKNLTAWFYYFFAHRDLTQYLKRQGAGRYKLDKNTLINIPCAIPPLPEQKAIAQTLSDVDALIDALDKLIAKKRHIKTATMQQLLTGKTRLPGFGEGKGYKKSAIGVIPEDWEVKYLKNALKMTPQYGINAPAVPYRDNLPIYIRITDISESGYFIPEKLVSVKQEKSNQYYLEEGDLVFARTGASVGKSYLYNPNDGKLVFAGFLIRIRPDENILLPNYLSHYIKTKTYWDWVQLMSMRSGQPGINGNEYGQLLVPLPKLEEQKAIAQVLSDMDKEITALEKRRAKTQAIKQGMMQELLTGRTRLKFEHPDDPITKNSNG